MDGAETLVKQNDVVSFAEARKLKKQRPKDSEEIARLYHRCMERGYASAYMVHKLAKVSLVC